MPIYEYRCRACGATTEQLRALADADTLLACACGSDDTLRLPSLIARAPGSDLPMAPSAAGSPDAGACCGGGCCG